MCVVEGKILGREKTESWLLGPQFLYLMSLSLSFLIRQVGIVVTPNRAAWRIKRAGSVRTTTPDAW